jgi:hypothetical protein
MGRVNILYNPEEIRIGLVSKRILRKIGPGSRLAEIKKVKEKEVRARGEDVEGGQRVEPVVVDSPNPSPEPVPVLNVREISEREAIGALITTDPQSHLKARSYATYMLLYSLQLFITCIALYTLLFLEFNKLWSLLTSVGAVHIIDLFVKTFFAIKIKKNARSMPDPEKQNLRAVIEAIGALKDVSVIIFIVGCLFIVGS